MDAEMRDELRELRKETRALREEVRGDILRMHEKLDRYMAAVNGRCAKRGEEIAVLWNHERERNRRIDRRIALGLLVIAGVTLLLRVVM